MEKEITRVTLDFDDLRDKTMPDSDLPLYGMVGVYKVTGIFSIVEKFAKENGFKSVDPKELLFCNLSTMKKLKGIITTNWETFNIDMSEDEKVFWKPGELKTRRKRAKKMKAKIRNSVNYNFAYFCPGLDEEVPDDVVVVRQYIKDETDPEPEVIENNACN